MNKFPILVRAVLVTAALLLAGPVFAQASRTWVSGVGDDVNPCSRTAPCRTFAGAMAKTIAGGEISVLDPGAFGAVTIDRSLTIDGNGVYAGVQEAAGDGIIVDAGPTGVVVLRNLNLEGVSTTTTGIRYASGKTLTIDHVTIRGFANAIAFNPVATANGRLHVLDSQLEANGTGILLSPLLPDSRVNATIARTRLVNNTRGVRAHAGSEAYISASTISGNTNAGISAYAPTGTAAALVSVDDSLVSGNGVGVKATQPLAMLILAGSTVSDNGVGLLSAHGATLRTFGDNQVVGNGDDGVPSGAPVPLQ